MNHWAHAYLEALQAHTSEVRVHGLDIASQPVPLATTCIELRVSGNRSTGSSNDTSHSGSLSLDAARGLDRRERVESEYACRVLGKERRVALIGDPGQGKTTVLRAYAHRLAQGLLARRTISLGRHQLPLFVECGRQRGREMPSADPYSCLFERVPDSLRRRLTAADWADISARLDAGQMCVIVDGFDELAPGPQRQMRELLSKLGHNRVLLGTRPDAYRAMPFAGFAEYRLRELDPVQVETLTRSLCHTLAGQYGLSDPAVAVQKVHQLATGPALAIVRNPLFLSFVCLTVVRALSDARCVELPTRTVPLIGECIDVLASWQRRRCPDWPPHLNGAEVTRRLAPLALETFTGGAGVVTAQSLQQLAGEDREIFCKQLVEAGFVQQQHSHYIFPLETFREFFAARALAAQPDPYAAIKPRLHLPQWERLIVYTTGCLSPHRASRIDLAMPTFTRLFVKYHGLLMRIGALLTTSAVGDAYALARRASGKGLEELRPRLESRLARWFSRSRHSVEYYVLSILRSGDSRGAQRNVRLALHCLGVAPTCHGSFANMLRIEQAFRSRTERQYRLFAAATTQECVRNVILGLLCADEAEVRSAAAETLARVTAEPAVCDGLLARLDDPSPDVRYAATEALGGVAMQPAVREALLTKLEDPEESVRWAAIEALGTVAALPSVHRPIFARLIDHDYCVRVTAMMALSRVAAAPPVRDGLLACLEHAEVTIRSAATEALAPIAADPLVRDALLLRLEDPSVRVRCLAIDSLRAVVADPVVWKSIVERLEDVDERVRAEAAEGLCHAAATNPTVVAALMRRLEDPHYFVRAAAASSLGEAAATEPEVCDALLQRLGEHRASIREAAVKALGSVVSNPGILDALLERMQTDVNHMVRCAAATALSELIHEPVIRDAFLLQLHDGSGGVRSTLLRHLEPLARDQFVRDTVLARLDDSDDFVRESAVQALRPIAADPQVCAALLLRLGDASGRVRSAAIEALRPQAAQTVVRDALVDRLADTDDWVRASAEGALREAFT